MSSKFWSRLFFGLWIVSAPLMLVGCAEEKATPAAKPSTDAGTTPPAGGMPKDAPK
jgi:hypothetical protein